MMEHLLGERVGDLGCGNVKDTSLYIPPKKPCQFRLNNGIHTLPWPPGSPNLECMGLIKKLASQAMAEHKASQLTRVDSC